MQSDQPVKSPHADLIHLHPSVQPPLPLQHPCTSPHAPLPSVRLCIALTITRGFDAAKSLTGACASAISLSAQARKLRPQSESPHAQGSATSRARLFVWRARLAGLCARFAMRRVSQNASRARCAGSARKAKSLAGRAQSLARRAKRPAGRPTGLARRTRGAVSAPPKLVRQPLPVARRALSSTCGSRWAAARAPSSACRPPCLARQAVCAVG